jgi:NAD(P)-dependent dehydrogenase (short-subunit alcohol dehydrogenase family)
MNAAIFPKEGMAAKRFERRIYPMVLKGKAAVVTGAGRGIGREVAIILAAEGAKVVAVDPGGARDGGGRDTTPVDDLVKQIKAKGGEAMAAYESVSDFAAAERIIKSCKDKFGSVDILYNGAGVLRERMIFNMSEDDWDTVISVHLKGTFNMCRHACVVMREQRSGRIINVTSDAWRGTIGQSNYAAAKAGIVGLTRSIAREMGRLGVTCNALCPLAATRMTMNDAVIAGFKKRMEIGVITKERYEELMAMPGPEFIAPGVAFLASDAAAELNGQVFGIYGGRVYLYSEPVAIKELAKEDQKTPWKVETLMNMVPKTILTGYVNPAPKVAEEGKKK